MADNIFDINVGTDVDTSGLEKGLDEAQKEILDTAAKLTQETEKAAQEQLDIIKETEQKKIEEIQKSIDEQIRLAKEKPGLDPSVLKAEIDAIKQAGNARIKEAQTSSELEQQIIRNAAKEKIKILQDYAKKQVATLKDGNKKSLQSIKDFTKGAVGELMGLDQVLGAVAGGPVALGKLFVDLGKKAVAALNEAAGAWREQEQAEVALTNAAKNNPYLNDRAVKQLNQFANEMQRLTGLDSVMITQTQTRLASLGRNQQQIQQILKVAADMAAGGVMDFDSAVNELNNSLNGMIRTSGRLYPELKGLSKEALASGQAIEIIGKKVAGSAAEAMKTGAGSVTAYKNALGDLKKIIGEGWEKVIRPFRNAFTDILTSITDTINKSKELRAALKLLKESGGKVDINVVSAEITVAEGEIRKLLDQIYLLQMVGDPFKKIPGMEGKIKEQEELIEKLKEEEKVRGDLKNTNAKIAEAERKIAALKLTDEKAALEMEEKLTEALKHRAEAQEWVNDKILQEKEFIDKNGKIAISREVRGKDLSKVSSHTEQADAILNLINIQTEGVEKQKDLREENEKALEKEIAAIKEQAKLEKKSINSAEVRTQILNARKNAYLSLVKEIGSAAAEEQRKLAQIQTESYSLAVEAANKLTEDNEKNLKNQIKWIEEKAKAEGKATSSMEVQKEIMDAQVNAYSNQLKILQDLIDGTGEEETARRKALQAQWDQYRNELQTAEAQKKRLDEAIKKQEELNNKIKEAQDIIKKSNYEYGLKGLWAELKEASENAKKIGATKEDIEKVNAANRAIVEYRLASVKKGLAEELNIIAKQIDEIKKKQEDAAAESAATQAAATQAAAAAQTAAENAKTKREIAEAAVRARIRAETDKADKEKAARDVKTAADTAERFGRSEAAALRTAQAQKEAAAQAAAGALAEKINAEAAAKAEADRAESAAKAADGIAAVRAEAVKLADTSDADKKIAELGRAADTLKKAFNAENAEAMRTVYDQMFDAVSGPKRAEQIRNLAKDQIAALKEMEEEELRMVGNKEEEKLAIKNKYKLMLEEVDKSMNETILRHTLEMYDKIAAGAQKVFDALSLIASNISAMWTNNIDYETNEKLKANDKIIQSDEERANAEKKIQIEAAQQRYKAELFAWQANVTMATAQAAMAILTAYTEGLKGGGTAAPIIAALQMALAAAVGGTQVAAVISARPKHPRFHTGGVVEGSGEQRAVLMGGEAVLTQKQFQNTMQAISNLANTSTGTGGVQMNVKIENNASNRVSATPQITADGLKVVIKEIVNEGFGDGTFDRGIALQQSNLRGVSLL